MPVDPTFLERLLLYRLDRAPAPALDLFGAAAFEAVGFALDVGVFEALSARPLTPAELAARLGLDANGVRALLGLLEATGYVAAESDGGAYRNTSSTERWLTPAAGTDLGPWLTFWRDLAFPFWREQLETAVREGEPSQTIYEWFGDDPGRWKTAQRGFRAAASLVVDEVAAATDVPAGATHLLDVGGGHGLFAVELCRRHSGLDAVVFDHPAALDAAREERAAAGLEDRVSVRGGDYLTDELGEGYDAVLLFNVVHAHDGAENVRLLRRVADALAPGGRVAVLDQLSGSARTPVGRAGIGFVGLTYLVTLGARTHPFEDVAEWLQAAGFEDVRRTSIRRGGPGNTLVQATKPRGRGRGRVGATGGN